jgi:hypothetical protein
MSEEATRIFSAMWSDAEKEAQELREAVLWLIPLARLAARPEDAERFAEIRALVEDERPAPSAEERG